MRNRRGGKEKKSNKTRSRLSIGKDKEVDWEGKDAKKKKKIFKKSGRRWEIEEVEGDRNERN